MPVRKMRDVMVDLETLGQIPGSQVIAIGAVEFDPSGDRPKLGREFYRVCYRKNQEAYGLKASEETLKWWAQQSPEAQKVLVDARSAKRSSNLPHALHMFAEWLEPIGLREVCIWGNGADFDNAMLAVAYDVCGMVVPWKFWNNRCFRTLKGMAPGIEMRRVGEHHNALDDARTQAVHACLVMSHLRGEAWGRLTPNKLYTAGNGPLAIE